MTEPHRGNRLAAAENSPQRPIKMETSPAVQKKAFLHRLPLKQRVKLQTRSIISIINSLLYEFLNHKGLTAAKLVQEPRKAIFYT